MSKKKRKSQLEDKSELSENEVSDSPNSEIAGEKVLSQKDQNRDFAEELEKTIEGLWYMSETDAEISVFRGEKAESVRKESLIEQLGISPETNIIEKKFADFFKNLIETKDWFGEEEKEMAEKFLTLKNLLEENLRDLKVFKVGQIEVSIYVIGLNSQNILMGINTKAVET